MTAQNRTVLKNYFLRGLRPTQSNYGDLIDSFALVSTSGDYVQKSGDTMTGPLILYATPSAAAPALTAITKDYVDTGYAPLNSPTFSGNPFLASASATRLSFTSTSGIIGTTTNDNAATGSVGEQVESVVTFASPTTGFVTGTPKNVTSISLTAGDWEVCGQIISVPNGATTTSSIRGSISTVTNTGAAAEYLNLNEVNSTGAGRIMSVSLANRRFSLVATTTIYLVAQFDFAVNAMGAAGFLRARRVR